MVSRSAKLWMGGIVAFKQRQKLRMSAQGTYRFYCLTPDDFTRQGGTPWPGRGLSMRTPILLCHVSTLCNLEDLRLQTAMDPLRVSDHVVRTGEQITHWDMLNKEHSNLVALVKMSQCVICSPVWRFVPLDPSPAKGS